MQVLSSLLSIPRVGAALITILPKHGPKLPRRLAVVTTRLTLLLVAMLASRSIHKCSKGYYGLTRMALS